MNRAGRDTGGFGKRRSEPDEQRLYRAPVEMRLEERKCRRRDPDPDRVDDHVHDYEPDEYLRRHRSGFLSRPAPQRHKTRRISYGGVTAYVDEALAGLLLSMWKAGIQTEASCEDVGGGLAEIHGSTGSAALSGRHYMRFHLADLPELGRALGLEVSP